MLRVAFLGNIANTHYRLARALRDDGAVDAHLFVSTSDAPGWRPEADDTHLTAGYPEWVHEGDWVTASSVLCPQRAAVTRELAAFDLVVASGVGPVFAQYAGRPWVFFVTGADLTVKPFPLTFWRWYPTLARRLAQVIAAIHQRRAIRRADRVLLQPFAPMVEAADRLAVTGQARSPRYFPLPVDTDRFCPHGPVADLATDADFVVFHPSRLVFDDSERMRRTGQWKGNDTLIRGFASFVRSGTAERPLLVLVDGPGSRDRAAARRLIAELGITRSVHWAVPPNGDLFRQPEMAALYRRADVVADEFGVGWFGFVTLEAAACGRPILSHDDEAVMADLYPWHPVVDASTADQVGDRLRQLAGQPDLRADLGARSRRWAEQFHSVDAIAGRYVDEFTSLAGELVASRTTAKATPSPARSSPGAPPSGTVAPRAQAAAAAVTSPNRPQS